MIWDIGSEVDDLVSGTAEHGAADVLSDLVDVSLDGSHDDGSLHSSGTGGHEGLEDLEGGLHGLGSCDDLGEVDLGFVEPVSDDLHSLSESVSDDGRDVDLGIDGGLCCCLGQFDVPGLYGLFQVRKNLLVRHISFPPLSARWAAQFPSFSGRGYSRGLQSIHPTHQYIMILVFDGFCYPSIFKCFYHAFFCHLSIFKVYCCQNSSHFAILFNAIVSN